MRDFIISSEMIMPLREARKSFLRRYFILVAVRANGSMKRIVEITGMDNRGTVRRKLISLDLWPRDVLDRAVADHIEAIKTEYLRFHSGTKNKRDFRRLQRLE